LPLQKVPMDHHHVFYHYVNSRILQRASRPTLTATPMIIHLHRGNGRGGAGRAVAESSCREVARCFTGTPPSPTPQNLRYRRTDGHSEFIYRIDNFL